MIITISLRMEEKNSIHITGKELREIMAEYAYNDDIMCDERQKVRIAKKAVAMLPEPDRIIFCLALDKESSREVGKILGCSHSTILKQLKKIKMDIMYNIMEILKNEGEDLED